MLRCLARGRSSAKRSMSSHPLVRTALFGISGHVQDQVYLLLPRKVCWVARSGAYRQFCEIDEAMTALKCPLHSNR